MATKNNKLCEKQGKHFFFRYSRIWEWFWIEDILEYENDSQKKGILEYENDSQK